MSSNSRHGNSPNTATYVQSHAFELDAALPDPGTEFQYSDIKDDLDTIHFQALVARGVIQHTERVDHPRRGNSNPWKYTVPEGVHNLIQDVTTNRDTLPCGHRGYRTITAGEKYQCTKCEQQYPRVVIEEVFGE